jgi:O-acetyl-ADP-ribose deacetylase (regulator of RNase III)
MNSGVAKAIRDKWPIVFQKYITLVNDGIYGSEKAITLLGVVQPVSISDTQKVLNLFGQKNYGYDGKQYTSYDAINTCFKKVAKYCVENGLNTIAMPYHMSCDRGGANWNVILELLKEAFENTEITIEIWKLNQ